MKRILSVITAITVFSTMLSHLTPLKVEAATWYYDGFETEESLRSWQSINGGSLEISDERYKIDNKSMKWTYENGGILKLTNCDALGQFRSYRVGEGIKLWIYSENKTDAQMIVKIGKSTAINDAPSYQFSVNMNFEGWRCIWARINEFAQTGNSNDGANSIQLELPKKMGNGVMYIDAFEVCDYVHYAACSDAQITNMPITNTAYQYATYCKIPEATDDVQCMPEHRHAFKIIEERLNNYILPQGIDYERLDTSDPVKIRYIETQKKITNYIKTYDQYNIYRREDGKMEGPGLTTTVDTIGVPVSKFEQIWIALALDWKLNKNQESLRRIMDLFDWSYEQGWAEGSSLGAIRFTELRTVGYAFAVYLLRDELRETGRLERELANLKWRSEFGLVFSYDDPYISEYASVDVDKLRSVVLYQLIYILSMDDSPRKVSYMKAYTKYFQEILAVRPGTDGGIKNDYTFWHHQGAFMSSYGAEAVNTLCEIKYFIHDTYFDINEETTEILMNTLRTYRTSADRLDIPLRLRGRFPDAVETMITVAPAYVFMAASGNREAAEIYIDIWDEKLDSVQASYKTSMPNITWLTTLGQLVMFRTVMDDSVKKGYTAAEPMSGTYIYPYGGYAIHRQDNWMAAVSGFSKYIWDYEGSTTENLFGRYMNYGSLTLTDEKGFFNGGLDTTKGWCWSRFPGTTAKNLSNDELELKSSARYYSDEPFLGGVSTGNSGVYAINLHDTEYDKSFRVKKTWFFFGDKIICLGSDISNGDVTHNTETTLFQNTMGDSTDTPIYVNNVEVKQFPYADTIMEKKTVYLTDTVGNGYIIPDANGLKIERKTNESKLNRGVLTIGNSTVAYINHGKAPNNAGYEYMILPQTTIEELAATAENKGYEILKKNNSAHIVKNTDNDDIAYVLFESGSDFTYGNLKSVTRPCIVMESKTDEGLKISFADPDLRVVTSGTVGEIRKKSEKLLTRVAIKGSWKLKEKSPSVRIIGNGNGTILEFDGESGTQVDALLVPKN